MTKRSEKQQKQGKEKEAQLSCARIRARVRACVRVCLSKCDVQNTQSYGQLIASVFSSCITRGRWQAIGYRKDEL